MLLKYQSEIKVFRDDPQPWSFAQSWHNRWQFTIQCIWNCLTRFNFKCDKRQVFFILQSIMGLLDKILGFEFRSVRIVIDQLTSTLFSTFLVGSYLNSILYTLEIITVIRYYSARNESNDSLQLRAVVYFVLFFDTISTFLGYAAVYLVCSSEVVFIHILTSPLLAVHHNTLGYYSCRFMWLACH